MLLLIAKLSLQIRVCRVPTAAANTLRFSRAPLGKGPLMTAATSLLSSVELHTLVRYNDQVIEDLSFQQIGI